MLLFLFFCSGSGGVLKLDKTKTWGQIKQKGRTNLEKRIKREREKEREIGRNRERQRKRDI